MKLSFHGADHDVTGSCHLVETGRLPHSGRLRLVPGRQELNEDNAAPSASMRPRSIMCCSRTPISIIAAACRCSPSAASRARSSPPVASRELARLVMLDSAHLQEEDAQRQALRTRPAGVDRSAPPLYTTLDATNSLAQFGRVGRLRRRPLKSGLACAPPFSMPATYLGSASILLEIEEGAATKRLLFSGDLGHAGGPLLRAPAAPVECRRGRHGNDLWRPSASAARRVRRRVVFGDRRRHSRAAATSSFQPSRSSARRKFCSISIAGSRTIDCPLQCRSTSIRRWRFPRRTFFHAIRDA